jgi:hypothetical protein
VNYSLQNIIFSAIALPRLAGPVSGKDRTHLRDLIEVGPVDADWLPRLLAVLAERLRLLLENPEG